MFKRSFSQRTGEMASNGRAEGVGGTVRRRWAESEKVRIVQESLEPGAWVCDVGRRNGVKAQQLSVWRSRARRGELVLPDSQAPAFVTVEFDHPGTRYQPRAMPDATA